MNPPKSCNGTRLGLIVTKVYDDLIEYKIITGPGAGEITFIPRTPLAPSDHPIPFRRLHFPLRVCFAMTIKGCSILYVMLLRDVSFYMLWVGRVTRPKFGWGTGGS